MTVCDKWYNIRQIDSVIFCINSHHRLTLSRFLKKIQQIFLSSNGVFSRKIEKYWGPVKSHCTPLFGHFGLHCKVGFGPRREDGGQGGRTSFNSKKKEIKIKYI